MTTQERDAMIRLAIAPPADLQAPADLADAIYGEILTTPQRRPVTGLTRLRWLPAPSPYVINLGLLVLLAVALVIVALSRPPATPILGMYHGGPDRTGVMPGPGPVGEAFIEWDEPRPGAMLFNTMPLPVGDLVIVGDRGGFLAALAADTGELLWERDLGSPISGPPAIEPGPAGELGHVLVGTRSGDVVAVAAEDGAPAWRQPLGDGPVLAALLVADGVAYAGTAGGMLHALDLATGTVQWRVDAGGAVTRGPAYDAGIVFVGNDQGRLSAVDVATESVAWSIELGPGEVGTPTVDGDRVYVARGILGPGDKHDLVAVNIRDRTIEWNFPSPQGEQVHMGGLADGRVYAVSEDHNVYALDAATGDRLWTAVTGGRVTALAAIVGDVVYVTSEDLLVRALDAATGREIWQIPVIGAPSMAAVVGGRVFVGTDLGLVVAIGGRPVPSP